MNSRDTKRGFTWWIFAVFIVLAISFLSPFWFHPKKRNEIELVNPKHFTKKPVRTPKFRSITTKDSIQYNCNDCHSTLIPTTVVKSYYHAHEDIVLKHGRANHCSLCHSSNNKEKLIDIEKNEIDFKYSTETCAGCHGPIYKDWKNGVHGRKNGFWNKDMGPKEKLHCVHCHDPHQPKFKSMEPAPGPHKKNNHHLQNLKRPIHE